MVSEMRTLCQAPPSSNGGRAGHLKHLQPWDTALCYVRVSAVEGEVGRRFRTRLRSFGEGKGARQ